MHLESRDPVEVTRAPCDNLITQGQCRGRDEEIGRRNPPAARAQPGIDLGEHARNREGDGEDWDRPQYGLNELLAARSSRRCVGTPAPVKQLCGTHDRETQFEVAPPVYQLGDEFCGSLAVPFGVDEDRRVDQESQDGRSSTGSPARTSSRSSPNRSSSTADDRPRR